MELAALLTASTPAMGSLALFVGRVFIGACFIVHALGKLGLVGGGNMQGFVAWLEELGVPYAPVQARVAMLSELVGGTLLLLGLFARPACVLLIATMIVATRLGHRDAGYLITNDPPGGEYTINLAVICLMFLLFGPGAVSLDYLLFQAG
ncbi:MAG: DoxX family protein [Deltaproteobacteria bacterium]|nr:DoxX family protein [Deltaproteobacteria bacterium]MBW2666575.1 DoxX family protein [Deltaproteobacteria bacterium]